MATRDRSTYSIKAVENALDLLKVFSDEKGVLSIANLCDRLGLQKSYVLSASTS